MSWIDWTIVVAYLLVADVAKFLFFRLEAARSIPHTHHQTRRIRRAVSGFVS